MVSKRGCTISISGSLLSLTFFCLSPEYVNADSVKWEDLAKHLAEKEIPLVQLNLCDCPDDIQGIEPDRIVSQIIENTFYLWEEYDITVDTEVYMCIVMKEPTPGPLTAQESRVLLTGSTLMDRFPPYIELPDEEEVVIDPDDRTRILDTDEFPWNTYCYLFNTFPPEKVSKPFGRGTGCLVTPYMVLTCAHNIYHFDTGSYIKQTTITPGQTEEHEWDTLEEPYGLQEIPEPRVAVAPEFIDSNDAEFDYGAIFLDKPFPGIRTYMPLEFSSSLSVGDIVNIAGYPASLQEETHSRALWNANDTIRYVDSEIIVYKTDISGGDSGAPILHKDSLFEPYRIVGIHSKEARDAATGKGLYNFGARLGAHNQALITEWMQWTPGAIFEDTFPSRTINTSKWTRVNGATVDGAGTSEPSSPYSLRLNIGDSVESRTIDLASYPNVTLTYSYQHRGDSSWLDVEYHNGSRWMTLDHQPGTEIDMAAFERSTRIHLPATALHANLRLRIKSDGLLQDEHGSGDSANWFVDDVKLMLGPNGPTGMMFVSIDDEGFKGEMSKYETTNAQYCQYLNAALADGLIVVDRDIPGPGTKLVFAASDTDHDQPYCRISDVQCMDEEPWGCYDYSRTHIAYGNAFYVLSRDGLNMANHPVVMVSWYGAAAFCDYYGYHLPGNLQLHAVADFDGTFTYACGASIDPTKANYGDNNPLDLTDSRYVLWQGQVYHPVGYTSPVGYYPAYGYGLCDMDGNVAEWTRPFKHCWGGSWSEDPLELDNIFIFDVVQYGDDMFSNVGFRVCR